MSVSEQIDTRSAAGRLVLNVLASVSQWEREVIGERTRDALAHKAARGEFCGGRAPYGYANRGGVLVEDDAEQRVITAATRARERGLSLRAVARELDRQGFVARSGKTFAATQIRRMLAA